MNLNFLRHKATLWVLFVMTLLITASFGVVMHIWDFMLIDEMYRAEQISSHIAAMSEKQK